MRRRFQHALILSLSLITLGCGGGGGGDGAPAPTSNTAPVPPIQENDAPTARVTFPGTIGLTAKDSVLVRGVAEDVNRITSVKVNGIEATSSDFFAHWHATVPLNPGDNLIRISTTDELDNTDPDAANLTVKSSVEYQFIFDIEVDAANNRIIVLDGYKPALVAVDMDSGARRIISGLHIPDDNNLFDHPQQMALDTVNNRALVTNEENGELIAVDLTTGVRTVISTAAKRNTSNFTSNTAIGVDAPNNRAVVFDASANRLILIDLSTGDATLLGTFAYPEHEPGEQNWSSRVDSIVVDSARNRALVLSHLDKEIIAVDLTTGIRTILSDNSTPNNSDLFDYPLGLTLDIAANRALVLNQGTDTILAIDLTTGVRSVIADAPTLSNYSVLSLDPNSNRAFIKGRSGLIAIDLSTGALSPFDGGVTHGHENQFKNPSHISIDENGNRAYILDRDLQAIIAMNLTTGARSVLSNSTVPNTFSPFNMAAGMAFDEANRRLLVVDEGVNKIIEVDTNSGNRTTFSAASRQYTVDAPNPNTIRNIIVDSGGNAALFIDDDDNSVLGVDLTSRSLFTLATATYPSSINPIIDPFDLALDLKHDRLLVTDRNNSNGRVVSIASQTLERDYLPEHLSYVLRWISYISIDPSNDRAFINTDGISTFNLDTGGSSVLIDSSGGAVDSFWPGDFVVDTRNNRILALDPRIDGIWAIDIESSERVLVSR